MKVDRRGRRWESATFIATVCVHMNGETATTVEVFGAVWTAMSPPGVEVLVSIPRT
jgi:hypothetical protein